MARCLKWRLQVKVVKVAIIAIMQWVRSLFGGFIRTRRLVGTDLHGNKYYETIREGKKPRREMISNVKHMQYTPGMMPIEWESWIRGKRDGPPTHEESIAQQKRIAIIKEKAKQLEDKDREEQTLEKQQPQLVSQLGHASATLYESLDNRAGPISTGTMFQPGEWSRRESNYVEKPPFEKGDEESFEPESWVPPANNARKK